MNEGLPLVCICIPTYNVAKTIKESIETILSQTYKNIVVHISDNASTDDTVEIIKSLGDKRIIMHCHDENIGGAGNLARCVEIAEGDYTAIFHGDDLYGSEMVARQVAFLESNAEICAVFTTAKTIDEQGIVRSEIGSHPFCKQEEITIFSFMQLFKCMLMDRNFLVCPSALVRTETYKNVIKTWREDLFKSACDVDTWLRLANSRPIAVINQPLMQYRVSSFQYSDVVRKRVSRSDFFLVMDHYLAQKEVAKFLTKKDLQHYGWLLRHENVACAMNLLLIGKIEDAKIFLKGHFCWDSLHAALSSTRGFQTFLISILIQALIPLGLSEIFIKTLKKIKNIS